MWLQLILMPLCAVCSLILCIYEYRLGSLSFSSMGQFIL